MWQLAGKCERQGLAANTAATTLAKWRIQGGKAAHEVFVETTDQQPFNPQRPGVPGQRPLRLGVLASHEGSVLQAVIDACSDGADRAIDGSIKVVISNNSNAGALRRARAAGIATVHLSSVTHPARDDLDSAICAALEHHQVNWVLLAGYMKQLGPQTLRKYAGRILNTHPSLLPKYGGRGFYGRRVHEAVLSAGDSETGATVHLVEDDYDSGPIVARVRVAVLPGDTPARLESRVKVAERALLLETLSALADGHMPAPHQPFEDDTK